MIHGIDSAVPQPGHYFGQAFAGFYVGGDTPHVWTRDEVLGLHAGGIRAGLPIVVPPQVWPWPAQADGMPSPDISGVLGGLITLAHRWGVPVGSPLALDIEPAQGDLMAAPQPGAVGGYLNQVRSAWRLWCAGRFQPVIYAKGRHQAATPSYLAWLAEDPWPSPMPEAVPQGYALVQYAQSADGEVDLDVAVNGLTWMATNLDGLVTIPTPAPRRHTDMLLVLKPGTVGPWYLTDGTTASEVASPEDLQELITLGQIPTLRHLSLAQCGRLGIPVS